MYSQLVNLPVPAVAISVSMPCTQVPGARLALVGDGPQRQELEQMFRGMPVKFMVRLQHTHRPGGCVVLLCKGISSDINRMQCLLLILR